MSSTYSSCEIYKEKVCTEYEDKIFDGSIFEIIENDELLSAFDSQTRVVQDNSWSWVRDN